MSSSRHKQMQPVNGGDSKEYETLKQSFIKYTQSLFCTAMLYNNFSMKLGKANKSKSPNLNDQILAV